MQPMSSLEFLLRIKHRLLWAKTTIIRATDGGDNWVAKPAEPADLNGVFHRCEYGCRGGQVADTGEGTILRTTDGRQLG